nr:hypothetical protein [uncultured Sulfurimonas sp.]
MSRKIALTLIASLAFTSTIYADSSEAKELFDEAKCMECHNNKDFKVREDKVNSFEKLHNSVNQCSFNSETGWFDDETLDVTKYLNKKFYHFSESKHSE